MMFCYQVKVAFLMMLAMAEMKKPYRLSLLSICAFTGYEPRDNLQCKAAQQMVTDIINNQTEILPDYHIELEFADEGQGGAKTPKIVLDYLAKIEQNKQADVYQAPLNLGPLLSGGCTAWGTVASYVNMVSLVSACGAPSQVARRDKFPNMYRPRCTAEIVIVSRVHFLRKMLPHIRRIGITTNLNSNPFNYDTASLFYRLAVGSGYQVAAYEASPDFNDETMLALKKADIRILTHESGEPSTSLRFMCQAYKFGMAGMKYLFIFQFLNYMNPINLPDVIYPGCTKEIIIEQLKRALFIGAGFDSIGREDNPSRSALGHTLRDFEAIFDRYTKGAPRTPDYDMRHICYDRVLQGAVILDKAEKILAKQQLSLRDYRNYPRQVMLATNQSAAEIDFQNLRHGRFHYSKRLEFDYEPQFVARWSVETGLQLISKVTCYENASSALDPDSYYIEQLVKDFPYWYFPRDACAEEKVSLDIPLPTFGVIAALALLTTLPQIAIFRHILLNYNSTSFLASKIAILVSCIIMNVAAVVLDIPNSIINATNANCNAKAILVVLSIAAFHVSLSFMPFKSYLTNLQPKIAAISLNNVPSVNRSDISTPRRVHNSSLTPTSSLRIRDLDVLRPLASFTIANAAILIAWLTYDPLEAVLAEPNDYARDECDAVTDTRITYNAIVCTSTWAENWMLGLFCLNFLPLFFGIYAAMKLRFNKAANRNREIGLSQIAITCSATLFAAMFAIVYIISRAIILRLEIAAFGLIFYSASLTSTIFLPVVKKLVVTNHL